MQIEQIRVIDGDVRRRICTCAEHNKMPRGDRAPRFRNFGTNLDGRDWSVLWSDCFTTDTRGHHTLCMGIWLGLMWSECRGGSLDYEGASWSLQATDQGLSDTNSYGIRSHYLLVGMLHVVDWYLFTEVSRTICWPYLQRPSSPRKDGIERLFQNIANVSSQKSRDLTDTAAEAWNNSFLVVGSWVQKKREALPTNNL